METLEKFLSVCEQSEEDRKNWPKKQTFLIDLIVFEKHI